MSDHYDKFREQRDDQRELEMERGRHVAARAANLDKIERMEQSKLVQITSVTCMSDDPHEGARRHDFIIDGVLAYTHYGPMSGPEYPPEALMAVLGLTIAALQLEVPPPKPTHRVSEEGRQYNREMAARNAARWSGEQ